MINVAAFDGTEIHAVDEGTGPPILVVHGGMGDSSASEKVAARLVASHRVVRLHRRQYRLELVSEEPATIAQEVADVLALADSIGEPVVLVGHSSGAVVALEAVVADQKSFVGLVAYEPPAVIGPPLGGPGVPTAWTAYNAGKPGKAFQIFLRTVLHGSPILGWAMRILADIVSRIRAFVPRQLADTDAIDALGDRRDAYATITLPTLFITGSKSPAHLGERVDALVAVIPDSTKVILRGQGHNGNDGDSDRIAQMIETFAASV